MLFVKVSSYIIINENEMRLLGLFLAAVQYASCVDAAGGRYEFQANSTLSQRLFKNGYRVNLNQIPLIKRVIPTNVSWREFENVSKIVTSAAYDIFSAKWKNAPVILKSLRNNSMRPGSPIEMEKEISILSRLEHPNIIKLLGSGYLPHRFQILEHLEGGTLHTVLRQRLSYPNKSKRSVAKLLPQEKMFDYAIKFANALHYMHEEFHPGVRMFHRDLKMQNVGLTKDGELKVFDFGMAEIIRKTTNENVIFRLGVAPEGGKALGTWPYTAPEVLRREKYNHKSDVYCYAIMLYYIMVGKHPMRHYHDHLELKKKVGIYNGWRPKRERWWPVELARLFAEIWNNDIVVRPTMKEVATRLQQINEKYPDMLIKPISHAKREVVEWYV